MKTGKTLQTLAFLTIFTLSSVVIAFNFKVLNVASSSSTVGPVIFVSPSLVQAEVGQNFSITVRVENLTDNMVTDPDNPTKKIPCGNLYGIDLQLGWDPTIIHCVSYTKKIPVETYPDGVMHSPTIPILNVVNENANMTGSEPGTTYWLAEASMLPAAVFNGAGNFVTMNFTVLKSGQSPIRILGLTMADGSGNPIAIGSSGTWLRPLGNATFSTAGAPIADFTFSPNIGVVNKTVTFNATSSQSDGTIVQYSWNFDDGTKTNETSPITEHVYNASIDPGYTVTLRVMDNLGVESAAVTKLVNVATTRDLRATSLALSQDSIRPSKEFNITATVDNIGTSRSDFYENATISLYYNVTAFDLNNTSSGTWTFIDSESAMIRKNTYVRPVFVVNSSQLPTLEALYYFLMNVTGVPAGYENNTANNIKLSKSLLYTLALLHKPTIFSFQYGYLFQNRAYKTPVLENEATNLNVTVQNSGNGVDSFNVTFLANGTVLGTTQLLNVPEGVQAIGGWSGVIAPGSYNISVVAQAGNASATRHVEMRVRKLPYLVIELTPSNPVVNQEVTLNASASKHLDPTGSLDMMIWTIYKPGTDENDGPSEAAFTLRGNANNASVNLFRYTFNMSGTWTVVLDVIDESKLTYAETRAGTRPYRLVLEVEVPEGFPMEIIIGAVALVAVLAIVIAFILIRRRRSPVVQPSAE